MVVFAANVLNQHFR